ncbi:hypothetical protein EYC84_001322 [Monilinia fructicola]|uniref:Uncharacterized protein n=1 Tax=Monilinia fructicola TaxID=38448 RepID=A0A5M9JP12_MONFR|nr:hypothetical protein EYC84_001322 [Monilinia fructicola]
MDFQHANSSEYIYSEKDKYIYSYNLQSTSVTVLFSIEITRTQQPEAAQKYRKDFSGLHPELLESLSLDLRVQLQRTNTLSGSQSSLKLQLPPINSLAVLHELSELTSLRSVALVSHSTNIQTLSN